MALEVSGILNWGLLSFWGKSLGPRREETLEKDWDGLWAAGQRLCRFTQLRAVTVLVPGNAKHHVEKWPRLQASESDSNPLKLQVSRKKESCKGAVKGKSSPPEGETTGIACLGLSVGKCDKSSFFLMRPEPSRRGAVGDDSACSEFPSSLLLSKLLVAM